MNFLKLSTTTQLNKFARASRTDCRAAAGDGQGAFVHLSDGTSRLQIYVRRQDIAGVRNDADGGEVDAGSFSICSIIGLHRRRRLSVRDQDRANCRCMLRSYSFLQRLCCRCPTRCTGSKTPRFANATLRRFDRRQFKTRARRR